jgi:coenzyme F420-reducing hydrogenase gamma subunit
MDPLTAAAGRARIATVWLGGCSGCHMSFLDMDERLLELAPRIDLVFSPIADAKVFPDEVVVTLVEGAVCNEEHLEMARRVRARSRLVVAFGDCAVTGNVTAIRNALGGALPVLERAYLDPSNLNPQIRMVMTGISRKERPSQNFSNPRNSVTWKRASSTSPASSRWIEILA